MPTDGSKSTHLWKIFIDMLIQLDQNKTQKMSLKFVQRKMCYTVQKICEFKTINKIQHYRTFSIILMDNCLKLYK